MINMIPELLVGYKVYKEGAEILGTADVELPDIEFMTETLGGSGIAGEIDTPVMGYTGSMTVTINWRTLEGDLLSLAAPGGHTLDFRGAVQVTDGADSRKYIQPVQVVITGQPKKVSLGKLAQASAMESGTELEVFYLKVWVGGREKIEIDKLNHIFVVDGIDYLIGVRAAYGLEG